tara:strand:+ start:1908 stop:2495 length:588 start_codon:yes stop_codon:yes gene_type:complete
VIAISGGRNLAALVLGGSLLAACESLDAINPFSGGVAVPECPPVALLKDADRLTAFAPGSGRDISDIVLETEITGFKGECEYIGDDGEYTEVVLDLRVSFDMILGPAAQRRDHQLKYFIAIPDIYPRPDGRSDFTAKVVFPPRRNRVTFTDDPLEIKIPLNENRKGPDTRVVISIALSREQLQFNRAKTKTRLRE